MCKSKWHLIIPNYRRIVDYHTMTGTNGQVYWSQTNQEHVQEGLPKTFSKELFDRIDKWFGPQMHPPPLQHIRDLMNPHDKKFYDDKDLSVDDVEVVDDECRLRQRDVPLSKHSHGVTTSPLPCC
jgi:hypothetical protein